MRLVLFVLCLTLAGVLTASAAQPRHKTISGSIVAYSGGLTCINGNAHWSILIQVQRSGRKSSEFVQASFSLACGASISTLWEKPARTRFRLTQVEKCDEVLKEFIPLVDDATGKQTGAVPNWTYVPGMEHERISFAQVVPCYSWNALGYVL